MTTAFLDTIREDGKLPAYAWPGGYPIVYQARDNGILCPKCANEYTPERDNEDQLQPVAYFVHYEGPAEQCENCNVLIESAYGDPDADTQEVNLMHCNQCEAAMINGVFCHETGCPNTSSRYDENSGEWIKQRKCFEGGCTVDADSECCTEEEN